jgi:putative nucleotidyltransferase with HDIG domain
MKVLIIDDGNGAQPLDPGMMEADDVWEATVAASTREALRRLADDSYDAVITSRGAEDNDTAAFLRCIGTEYPGLMRILLTQPLGDLAAPAPEQLDGLVEDTVPLGRDLRRAVEHAINVSASGDPDAMRAIIGKLGTLPARPGLYSQLTSLVHRGAGAKEIGQLIETDVAVTAQLLRTANSAFYSPRTPAVSASDVVARLGLDTVGAIVLQADGIRSLGIETRAVLEQMNEHSLRLNELVRRLIGPNQYLLLAAMLHDIGRMVLLARFPEEAARFDAEFGDDELDRVIAEREVIGADHAAIGGFLLRMWGMPEPVVRIVEFHHEPWRLDSADGEIRALAGLFAAAHHVDQPHVLPQGADEPFAELVARVVEATAQDRQRS